MHQEPGRILAALNASHHTDTPVHHRLRDARRARGLSQAALADAVTCQQSAISMMETGRRDALSRDKLLAVAELLGVEGVDAHIQEPAPHPHPALLKICPAAECPSNTPYLVAGELRILPQAVVAPATAASYCALCGEVLETTCPGCRAPVRPGACCSDCGSAYVPLPALPPSQVAEWARQRRELAVHLRGLLPHPEHTRSALKNSV